MHFVNTYSTSESTITGFVDEIAKIEKWPYAGTDMAMMGFKSVTWRRENVDLAALNSIITGADSTRKITFLYTKNNPVFPSVPRADLHNICPYLKILIAPEATTFVANFEYLNMSLIDLPKIDFVGLETFEAGTYNLGDSKIPIINKLFLSGCTTIGSSAFYGMTINQIEVPLVSSIGSYAFCGVKGLSSITLPEIINIPENCFRSAYNLQTVSLPKCEIIEDDAFRFCSNLTSVYLGASSVVQISPGAFGSTPLVTNADAAIYVPESLITDYKTSYSIANYGFSDKFQPIEGDIL